mmetsp:Transcript_40045/g.80312  ORF Transcript_40045/g.80312 Transcript_40045/m.80312 type:complete len:108 (+) Transcript_40045:153-476(+)
MPGDMRGDGLRDVDCISKLMPASEYGTNEGSDEGSNEGSSEALASEYGVNEGSNEGSSEALKSEARVVSEVSGLLQTMEAGLNGAPEAGSDEMSGVDRNSSKSDVEW